MKLYVVIKRRGVLIKEDEVTIESSAAEYLPYVASIGNQKVRNIGGSYGFLGRKSR